MRRIFAGLAPAFMALVLMMVFAAWHWPFWAQSFSSDFSPASWLSAALLLAAACLAARLGIEGALDGKLSLWLAFALFELALDEQFLLHERWKYGCEHWLSLCAHAWMRDLPIYLVALLGALSLGFLYRSLADRPARCLIGASLGVGLFAIGIDLMELSGVLGMLEEGFEVLAEALFIGALLLVPPARRTGEGS